MRDGNAGKYQPAQLMFCNLRLQRDVHGRPTRGTIPLEAKTLEEFWDSLFVQHLLRFLKALRKTEYVELIIPNNTL